MGQTSEATGSAPGPHLLLHGSTRLFVDRRAVALPGRLARRLLCALVVGADRGIDDDELIEWIWTPDPPRTVRYSLRNTVARLRLALGPDALLRTTRGYRIDLGAVRTDLADLEEHVGAARAAAAAGDLTTAQRRADAALALASGPVLEDIRDEWWARPTVLHFEELAREADELWAEAVLHRPSPGTADLERIRAAVLREPLRERRWSQLIDALHRAGRRVEALRAAQEARQTLREFGITAGDLVTAAEQRALGGDESERSTSGGRRLAAVRELPLVGRDEVVGQLTPPPPMAVVCGEAGAGSTRVVAEVAHHCRKSGTTVLYVSVDAPSSGLRPVIDLALEATEAAGCPTPPELALAVDGRHSESAAFHPIPEVRTSRTQRVIADVISEAARTGSLLVAIDNAHFLDSEAATILAAVLAERPNLATLLILRTGPVPDPVQRLIGRLGAGDAVPTIELAPLDRPSIDALIRLMAPGLTPAACTWIAEAVTADAGGNPMRAIELARMTRTIESPVEGTNDLRAVFGHLLDRLDPVPRKVVDLLAAARRPVGITALASDDPRIVECIDALIEEHLLVEVRPGVVTLRVGMLADAARSAMSRQRLRDTRVALVAALEDVDDPLARQVRAEQILELHPPGASERDALDDCVLQSMQDHLVLGDSDSTAALGRRYLERVGIRGTSERSTEILLLIGRTLLGAGDVEQGHQLLEVVTRRAEDLGRADLLAEAVLARGPIETGAPNGDDSTDLALRLIEELDPSDAVRRVQLATWAAHHLLNGGRRAEALALLDTVDGEATVSSYTVLRSLVLGMRLQAMMLVEGSLPEARRAHAELRAWHSLSGDETARASAVFFEPQLAYAGGSMGDVERAAEAVREVAAVFRRSDLRWLPSAITAGRLLAAGEIEAAGPAITEAERLGNDLLCAPAGPVAQVQRLLLGLLDGSFASMAPLLEPPPDEDTASVQRTALWGLACARGGDRDGAKRAADGLAASPHPLLASAGMMWALIAMATAETAFAGRHEQLALRLWSELQPWSASGLSVFGVAYVGSADLWLGLAGAAAGLPERALELLDRAEAFEATLGATPWLHLARARRAECLP